MLDQTLIQLLACPHTQQDLFLADQAQIDQINTLIKEGSLLNRSRRKIKNTIDAGLIQKDTRELLYPVIDGIPVLLVDEAIVLKEISE